MTVRPELIDELLKDYFKQLTHLPIPHLPTSLPIHG
jgi:hypothetical protein